MSLRLILWNLSHRVQYSVIFINWFLHYFFLNYLLELNQCHYSQKSPLASHANGCWHACIILWPDAVLNLFLFTSSPFSWLYPELDTKPELLKTFSKSGFSVYFAYFFKSLHIFLLFCNYSCHFRFNIYLSRERAVSSVHFGSSYIVTQAVYTKTSKISIL